MGKGKKLSEQEKFTIRKMREDGKSIKEIGRVINRTRCVITSYLSDPSSYGLAYKGIKKLQNKLMRFNLFGYF